MKTNPEQYYQRQPEPYQSCLLALKDIILSVNENISHERKFQIPFFYFKEKKLAFLWVNRKKLMLGFVTDKSMLPKKENEKHKDAFSMMNINPNEDIPVDEIRDALQQLIDLYEA